MSRAKTGPIIEANYESATDKIRSQGLSNGELLDLIKIFVAKVGESESKSMISTYLLDRQFHMLTKSKAPTPASGVAAAAAALSGPANPLEEILGEESEDEVEDPQSTVLTPELVVPIDVKTGEMLLEGIEDMPESFEDMTLREEVLAGVRECGLLDVCPLIQISADSLLNGRDALIRTTDTPDQTSDRIALYCMSVLQRIDTTAEPIQCQAIILCPSGDVVESVFGTLTTMGGPSKIEVFGAVDDFLSEEDAEVFEIGVHVVIAMPALVSTLFSRGYIKGSSIKVAVIDSAEEMEEAEYMDNIADCFGHIPEVPLSAEEWDKTIFEEGRRRISSQLMLFTSDVSESVQTLTRRYTKSSLLYLSFMNSKEFARYNGEKYHGSSDSEDDDDEDDDDDDDDDDDSDEDDEDDDDSDEDSDEDE